MELEKFISFKINDLNCEFRALIKKDVSQDSIDGFKEQSEYIENIPAVINISDLTKPEFVKKVII